MRTPIIYNLFPRLVGSMDRWEQHFEHARDLGFNWIYLNPIHYPGFSGSLYSVKDYYRVNPLFLPPGTPENSEAELQAVADMLAEAHQRGLRVMMDLVVNHTAIDSVLIDQHPAWYERDVQGRILNPSAIDPADARKVTVWGDLAVVDNEEAPDRNALWEYWRQLVTRMVELGFDGFRCDAAYQVPMKLWDHLITAARQVRPDVAFFAETLGCRLEEVEQFAGVGFSYLFNSSKWWNFDAPWCLQQHEAHRHIAPSIAFPESHDSERLAVESGGLEQVQKQRYAFAAAFSEGLMMPIGYEYGFRKKLDVVNTLPSDWEKERFDISPFIRRVNAIKREFAPLAEEGRFIQRTSYLEPTIILEKWAENGRAVLVVVNKDWFHDQTAWLPNSREVFGPAPARALRLFGDTVREEPAEGPITLEPAEVVFVVPR